MVSGADLVLPPTLWHRRVLYTESNEQTLRRYGIKFEIVSSTIVFLLHRYRVELGSRLISNTAVRVTHCHAWP